MLRSALVWTLIAIFLTILPVTGAGSCPCRFVKPLRTPPVSLPKPPTPACKCCHDARTQDAKPPTDSPRSLPEPDAPCDHSFKADAAPSDRPHSAYGEGDAGVFVAAGPFACSRSASVFATGAADSALTLRTGPHLIRYVHAFRC